MSLIGALETPRELQEFASQLSPHLGLTPSAMLDFLATEDAFAQFANAAGGLGSAFQPEPSPLLSARAQLATTLAPSAPPLD